MKMNLLLKILYYGPNNPSKHMKNSNTGSKATESTVETEIHSSYLYELNHRDFKIRVPRRLKDKSVNDFLSSTGNYMTNT